MSVKSRRVAQREDEQSSELESQQRLRTELARSSTTLRRAPQLSEDTLEAIQASLEAAFDQLDGLETGEPAIAAGGPAQQSRRPADARSRMPPLPRMPPPLPRQAAPRPAAATPAAALPSPARALAAPRPATLAQPPRKTWPRALIASLALLAIAAATLRVAVPEHPIWRALERATTSLGR